MAVFTRIETPVAERTSARMAAVLQDEDGVGIDGTTYLDTLTLTLFVEGSPTAIINSRNKQDVLNINGVTVDASGNLTWQMEPDDNAIIDPGSLSPDSEYHVALFEWSFSGGIKEGRHKVILQVVNLENVA